MNGRYGIATPKSEKDRQDMQKKIGRDHFFFKSDPVETLARDGQQVELRWPFHHLDPMIRIALTVQVSRLSGASIKTAHAVMQKTGAIFMKDDFDLTYTDTMPDDWATAYPLSNREGQQSS